MMHNENSGAFFYTQINSTFRGLGGNNVIRILNIN